MPNIHANVCHPSALEPQSLLRDCSERRTRRSGPGGQHRNKVETAVVLRHEPTGIDAEGNERRSQAENRQVALFRLRVRLAVEFRETSLKKSRFLIGLRIQCEAQRSMKIIVFAVMAQMVREFLKKIFTRTWLIIYRKTVCSFSTIQK